MPKGEGESLVDLLPGVVVCFKRKQLELGMKILKRTFSQLQYP